MCGLCGSSALGREQMRVDGSDEGTRKSGFLCLLSNGAVKGCPNVPVLVVCCKSDVPGSKHKDSVAAFFGFAAQEKMIMFVAASAITADDKKVSFVPTCFQKKHDKELGFKGIIDGLAWLEKKLHEP